MKNLFQPIVRDVSYFIATAIATFLVIVTGSLIVSDILIEVLWGASSIFGTIGLWLALFRDPKNDKMGFLICLFLLLGILAFLPLYKNIHIYHNLGDWIFLVILNLPVIVAVNYIFKTLVISRKS